MSALTATPSVVTVFAYGLFDDADDMNVIVVAGDHTADLDAFLELCLAQINAEEEYDEDDDCLFDRAAFEDEFRWTAYTTPIFTIA